MSLRHWSVGRQDPLLARLSELCQSVPFPLPNSHRSITVFVSHVLDVCAPHQVFYRVVEYPTGTVADLVSRRARSEENYGYETVD
jgi:hypothetical protein